jgi:hypothetical protein
MKIKSQMMSSSVEKFNAINNANDERPERLFGSIPGSWGPRYQQLVETMTDQEYMRLMEERYGILEEGFF